MTMMSTKDRLTKREYALLGAAKEMATVMHGWNILNLHELVIEDSRKGTPYHHATSSLGAILVLLGVTNPEHKMAFYDMVTTGMSAAEAVARIKEFYEEYQA